MAFILGKKVNMTQIWKDEKVIPVTVVHAGPIVVTHVRDAARDGYAAVQVGFDPTKKKVSRPLAGHLKDLGNFRYIKEFRVSGERYARGATLHVDQFKEGEKVRVSGVTKGHGFQGVVKRHGFAGGPKTHGQKDRHRAPGSIGATAPQRVMPGLRMAGRMGGVARTIKNVRVIAVDPERNVLLLMGAVPGHRGSLLKIESAS